MKRFLSIMLVAVLLVTCMSTVAFAEGSASATVASSQNVEAGQKVTLTVTVSGKFTNYEMTLSASNGLKITAIEGITNHIKSEGKSAKVAYATSDNIEKHSFTVTVLVPESGKGGDKFNLSADVTLAYMKVDPSVDTEDGYVDGRVAVSMSDDSATLSIICTHAWGEWTETKAPTCTEKGAKERVCTICGEKETAEVDPLDHSWDEGVVTEEATCGKDGKKVYTCLRCGETKDEVIPATGNHSYEWTVTKAPTCTEKGIEKGICSVCGHETTREIDVVAHTPGAAWVTDETHHWHTCSVCGEKSDKAEHTWGEWKTEKEPTETEKGLKSHICTVCERKETAEIPKLDPKPTDPTDPSVPSEPTDPTDPSVPSEPTDPTDPTDPSVPSEPSEPTKPGTDPEDPPKTGDPTIVVMVGGLSILLLLLLAALYYIKRKASAAE